MLAHMFSRYVHRLIHIEQLARVLVPESTPPRKTTLETVCHFLLHFKNRGSFPTTAHSNKINNYRTVSLLVFFFATVFRYLQTVKKKTPSRARPEKNRSMTETSMDQDDT